MFSTEYLRKIYKCYDAEIDTRSFQDANMHTLLKTLILYKELSKNMPQYNSCVEDVPSEYAPLKLLSLAKELTINEFLSNSIVFFPAGNAITEAEWFDKDGWYQELISVFVNRQFGIKDDEEGQCRLYINAEAQSVYIELPSSMGINGMQLLMCGLISKLMPWFFSAVDKDTVVEITKVLDNHGNNGFDELFEQTVKDAGIVQKIMEKDLQRLGERLKATELEDAEDRVRAYQQKVNGYFADMCAYNDKLREAKNRLKAIRMDDDRDGGVKEVIEFLQGTTQDITIDHIDECTIGLVIRTTFQTFDEWETYVNMEECYLYREGDGYGIVPGKKSERAYTKLFSDSNFKIHTAVGINLNLRSGEVYAFTPTYNANESEHPHLNSEYSCFGTAGNTIAEYIKDFRYVEALNQLAYAARQFTVSDGAAGNKLLRGMRDKACIELPNGEFVNMNGLLKYLDETEGELE